MDFDLSGVIFMAIVGLVATVLCIVALIVAVVTYFLGYWSFGITI